MRKILILFATAALCACGNRQPAASADQGDTVHFKYARLLTVVRHKGYTDATVANPWKEGAVLHRYRLVEKDSGVPADGATLVHVPLQRSCIFTTVHCAMLLSLHQEERIAAVADLKYIKLPWIQAQVKAGRISDVGDGLSPVVEKIIDQKPDALLLSPFENSGGYGRLEELGIPLIECAEYMEPSPLARAEWLRFYGMLFGCGQQADSLFHVVDSSYCALKAQATRFSSKERPRVLLDKITGSVWYVPGGRSTIGQMIQDAGADYPWATDDHSGSVSLPFEAVVEKAGDADLWLFRYSSSSDITLRELSTEHHGYPQFRPFREQRVYGCNVELSTFYEESPFRPDWLLSDFISIFHPEAAGDSLRYYKKLK
ncbi:MAG: ABC transporter substrate-binding protein [Prevotella sp.]|nr:ABC transporter substrate-binding protein [Prevotella sp.]